MSKNVLIISTSPRKRGNSDSLANAFAKGAADAGNTAEKVTLCDKRIEFCKGCLACQETNRCVIHDDADRIVQQMLTTDVLLFATPIYYYEMSGQMKTMLDRSNPLYSVDYAFRDIYLLAAAAEEEESTVDGTLMGLSGWISCFPKSHLAGMVFAGGVNAVGDIQNHPALKTAYEIGNHISG